MTTLTYDEQMSMRDARQRYFDANGFDGSYSGKWVKLQAGPIAFYIPNAEGRRRAVKFHDLHHIITGYQTDWTGEVEIGAFEVGGGCGPFLWAWFLNLQAMLLWPFVAPRRAFRAFVRGRHARTLYHQGEFQDALLERSVGDIRNVLDLNRPPPPATLSDLLAFSAWTGLSLSLNVGPLIALAWWLL
jgi:hypothetical protein